MTPLPNFARRQKAAIRKELQGWHQLSPSWESGADLVNGKSPCPQTGSGARALPFRKETPGCIRREPQESEAGKYLVLDSRSDGTFVLSQSFVVGRLSCLRGVAGMTHSLSGG